MAVKSSASTLNGQFRNKIINGNFDFWQRGTSLSAATGNRYLADRWKMASSGTTHTTSRVAFTLGQTEVPGEPTYYLQTTIATGSAASNYAYLAQFVEGVRTFAGKATTFSFYAKADAPRNISIEFYQNMGVGGTGSAYIYPTVRKIALTTSFQKYTVTVQLPSLSGKTIGTDDSVFFYFFLDAGSDFNSRTDSLGNQSGTFSFSRVQWEEGVQATDFEFRPLGTELALCQRYYEKSYGLDEVPGTASESNNEVAIAISTTILSVSGFSYKVTKRIGPVVSIWSRSGVLDRVSTLTANNTVGTSFSYAGGGATRGIYTISDTTANFTAGQAYRFSWAANAEY